MYMSDSHRHRHVKPNYVGRNGFTESIEPRTEAAKQLAYADTHRWAQYVLQQRGSYCPSLKEMKDIIGSSEPDPIPATKNRLQELRKVHSKDLINIYDTHAQDYHREVLDRYLAKDETQYLVRGENNPVAVSSYSKLDNLYKESRRSRNYLHTWAADVDRLRHGYLTQALPLYTQLASLETSERAAFPSSIREYSGIRNKDVQLRIARFLMADDLGKEKMMKEFGWAWRKVKMLCDEYDRSTSFKADILEKVREVEVRDPRRKG